MIYLFIELPFAPQLVRLKPELFTQWLEEQHAAVEHFASGWEQIDSHLWVIEFPHMKAGNSKLAHEGIGRSLAKLEEWQATLLSFHGILVAAPNAQVAQEHVNSFRLAIPRQNRFWASENAQALFPDSMDFIPFQNKWYELRYVKEQLSAEQGRAPKLLSTEARETFGWFTRTKGPGILHVQSNGLGEAVFTSLFQEIVGDEEKQLFWIQGGAYDRDDWEPLVRGFRLWGENHIINDPWVRLVMGIRDSDSSLRSALGAADLDSISDYLSSWLVKQSSEDRIIIVVSGVEHLSDRITLLIERITAGINYSKPVRIAILETEKISVSQGESRDFNRQIEVNGIAPSETRPRSLEGLGSESMRILILCGFTRGLIPFRDLTALGEELGVNRLLIPGIIKSLAAKGYLVIEELLYISDSLLESWQQNSMGAGGPLFPQIRSCLANRITLAYNQARITMQRIFWEMILTEQTNWKTVSILGYSLILGQSIDGLSTLCESIQQNMAQRRSVQVFQEGWLRLFQTEVLHISDQSLEAEGSLVTIERLPGIEESQALSGFRKLLHSRLSFFNSRWDNAIGDAKTALLIFQNIGNAIGGLMGMLLYGEICCAKNKLSEAKEYFLMATREAETTGIRWLVLLCSCYEAFSWFAGGFYTRVLGILEKNEGLVQQLSEAGFLEWACYAKFLHGRVRFGLGDYSAAYSIFSTNSHWVNRKVFEQWRNLFSRWTARCQIYLDQFDTGIQTLFESLEDSSEAKLFLGEAFILKGDYAEAHRIFSEPAGELQIEKGRIPFITQPISGFWLLEDRFIGSENGATVECALFDGYRALAMAKLGHVEDGREILTNLTRNRPVMQGDPYHHWYLFWYQRVLEESIRMQGEEGQEDYITVLGKAVKAMQERNSRIEDPAHRRLYLTNEYWNKHLIRRGKKNNLM